MTMQSQKSLWVVSPALNERDNFIFLFPEMHELQSRWSNISWLIVDDGSSDDLRAYIEDMPATSRNFVVLINSSGTQQNFRRGKSSALRTGFKYALASGAELIAMMDIDGQDVPSEIPNLAFALGSADLVSGRRSKRKDAALKRLSSSVFNQVGNLLSKSNFDDANSGLKLMKATVAEELTTFLHGDFHRYMLVIAEKRGFKVVEREVIHKERHSGKSKYGIGRSFRGLFDLVSVLFLVDYESRPLHFLGGAGMFLTGLGAAGLAYLGGLWVMGESIGGRPLFSISIFLLISGLQLTIFGLLAQLIVHRTSSFER